MPRAVWGCETRHDRTVPNTPCWWGCVQVKAMEKKFAPTSRKNFTVSPNGIDAQLSEILHLNPIMTSPYNFIKPVGALKANS